MSPKSKAVVNRILNNLPDENNDVSSKHLAHSSSSSSKPRAIHARLNVGCNILCTVRQNSYD